MIKINNVKHRISKHGKFAQFYDELRKCWKTSRFLNIELLEKADDYLFSIDAKGKTVTELETEIDAQLKTLKLSEKDTQIIRDGGWVEANDE